MLDLPPVSPVVIEQACDEDFNAYIKQYSSVEASPAEKGENSKQVNATRIEAIIREARIVGSQAGRETRSAQIAEVLNSEVAERTLNSFSFRELMYQSNIVPPVITEVGPSVSVENGGKKATSILKSWRIIKSSYITTGQLSWRSYLLSGFSSKARPRGIYSFFAPRGAADKKVWRENYCQSYIKGFDTANAAFMQNMNRFRRDYLGMIRFKKLEQAGIVSAPRLRESRVGIVVNDKWTAIDKRDLRITAESRFKDLSNWDNVYVER